MNNVSISHHQKGECKVDETPPGTILVLAKGQENLSTRG